MKIDYLVAFFLILSATLLSCTKVANSIKGDETRTDLAKDYQDIIEAIFKSNEINLDKLKKELSKEYKISEEAIFYDFDTTYGYMMTPKYDNRNYDLELLLDKNRKFKGIFRYKP